ncbi:hypothetical protein CC2G_013555 [Coprinopsis cinerea AmutBmut pab1-1]|nr:hypothetical protein CC2G_013555 [Coprinopsis cinerea AmutBmut pab1-1]
MAPRKSTKPKTPKVTYAERVLNAYHALKKERRVGNIHLAGIRAQVKRTAEEKGEQLGPNWSHWVSKAVDKLTEDGILGMGNQRVFLTPEGKSTIATAKRSVRHVGDPEERLFKHVASIAASKRRYSVSAAPGAAHDDEAATSISAARAPKRPRRHTSHYSQAPLQSTRARNTRATATNTTDANSATPVRRGPGRPSRKSTVRIVAPLAQSDRDASPLTDISDLDAEYAENNAQLREALRRRDDVISGLQRRLEEAVSSRQVATAVPRPRDDDGDSDGDGNVATVASQTRAYRPPTTSVTEHQFSSPTIQDRPGLARYLVSKGLTRTLSGSVIPDISKQPTPAPSEGEHHTDEVEQVNNALPSPESSPITHIQELQDDIEVARDLLNDRVDHAETELEKAKAAFSDRIQALEDEVHSRDTRIEELNRELENVRENAAHATSELSSHASKISDMEQTLQSLQKENEFLREQLRVQRESGASLGEQLNQKEAQLQQVYRELEESSSKAEALETRCNSNATTIAELEASVSDGRQQLLVVRERCTELESTSRGKDQQLDLLQSQLVSLSNELDSLRSQALDRQEALAKATADLGEETERRIRRDDELATKERELIQVRQDLDTSSSEVERLGLEVEQQKDTVRDLESQLATATDSLQALEVSRVAEVTRHEEEERVLKDAISQLERTIGELRVDVEESQRKLTVTELEREELRAQGVGLQADLLTARMELEGEKQRGVALQLDLGNQLAKTQEVQDQLARAMKGNEALQEENKALRALVAKFHGLAMELDTQAKAIPQAPVSVG